MEPSTLIIVALVILAFCVLVWLVANPASSSKGQVKPHQGAAQLLGATPTVGKFNTIIPPVTGIRPSSEGVNVGVTAPYYDLRQAYPGLITPAMDQGQCEACWAFATTTAMSDAIRVRWPSPTSTPQQPASMYLMESVTDPLSGVTLLNVVSPYYFDACATGLAGSAACQTANSLSGAMQTAVVTDPTANQPLISLYCRKNQESGGGNNFGQFGCEPSSQSAQCHHYSLSGFSANGSDANGNLLPAVQVENNMQNAILGGAPVVTGIQVFPSFQTWWGQGAQGVYVPQAGEQSIGGHAVTILGWGPNPSDPAGTQPYWLIRNSWGQGSGDAGVFRMVRGQDACGVESNSYALTVNQPQPPANQPPVPPISPTGPVQPPPLPLPLSGIQRN